MAKHTHKLFKSLQTFEDRISDRVTNFVGSMKFLYIHSAWFILWGTLNIGLLGSGFIFDQYPFGLLTLIVSLEAIFLSTFVMISQNRQAKISELRSQLDYETDVMAEREIEVIMETLERMTTQMDIDIDDLTTKIQILHREEKKLINQEKTISAL